MLSEEKIAIIGGGVMGEAIVAGLLRNQVAEPSQIIVTDPHEPRTQTLAQQYEVHTSANNLEAIDGRAIVILAVKPQIMGLVLRELHGAIDSTALVISIAAGITLETLSIGLGSRAIVRSMPNTPGQIGCGITVWAATPHVTAVQRKHTELILSALGGSIHVDDESFLDMATALSGTGPAYILLFMEAMIDAGVHLGFSRHVASELVFKTMSGTVEYARQSREHPAALRNQVTSAGGTTAEALYHLEKGGFRTVIARAIWAAYQRSVALGGGDIKRRLAGHTPENGELPE